MRLTDEQFVLAAMLAVDVSEAAADFSGWFADNRSTAAWLAALSVVTFVATLVVLPIIIARLPANYFTSEEPPPLPWQKRHPVLGVLFQVAKNVLGLLLLTAGFVMLVTPGQGLLSMLMGVALLDLPGKRQLQLKMVQNRTVWRSLNWIRRKANRPPLERPPA